MQEQTKISAQPALAEIHYSLQESGKRLADVRSRLYSSLNRFHPDHNLTEKPEDPRQTIPGVISDFRTFAEDLKRLASIMEQDVSRLEQII